MMQSVIHLLHLSQGSFLRYTFTGDWQPLESLDNNIFRDSGTCSSQCIAILDISTVAMNQIPILYPFRNIQKENQRNKTDTHLTHRTKNQTLKPSTISPCRPAQSTQTSPHSPLSQTFHSAPLQSKPPSLAPLNIPIQQPLSNFLILHCGENILQPLKVNRFHQPSIKAALHVLRSFALDKRCRDSNDRQTPIRRRTLGDRHRCGGDFFSGADHARGFESVGYRHLVVCGWLAWLGSG
jgi:hypothetical protein